MKYRVRLTLFYLLLVSVFGMLMRHAFIQPGGFVFQFLKHTHSHVAFLGWVFNAIFILIVHSYFKYLSRQIKWQFYLFQLSVIGMLCTFPFQGYAPLSIAFSTAHVLISIWFYFTTITKIKGQDSSVKWIKLAAFYMVISNLGPLSLGPILMSDLKDSFIYHLSLQHYLHFQYNGWFIIATVGLLIKYFGIKLPNDKLLFWLLGWSVIPLFFITIEFIEPNPLYRMLGLTGALAQLVGVVVFVKAVWNKLGQESRSIRFLIGVALVAFLLKSVFQLTVAFPSLSSAVVNAQNPVIGFLHLIFLGVITNLLMALFSKAGFVKNHLGTLLAVVLFNFGFIIMVLLLFVQPFYVPPHYFHWLFYSTVPIFVGVLIYNIQGWK